jgi:Phage late-transcription coactivator
MTDMPLVFDKGLVPDNFYKEIDSLVKRHQLKYMDAIVHYCETNKIEIETAASMIKSNGRIKALLQLEGESLNFLAKTAKLKF